MSLINSIAIGICIVIGIGISLGLGAGNRSELNREEHQTKHLLQKNKNNGTILQWEHLINFFSKNSQTLKTTKTEIELNNTI